MAPCILSNLFSASKRPALTSHQNLVCKKPLAYKKTLTHIGTSRKRQKKKRRYAFLEEISALAVFSLPSFSLKSLQSAIEHSSALTILGCKTQSSRSPESVAAYPQSPVGERSLGDRWQLRGERGTDEEA